MITLPVDFLTDLSANIGTVFTDVAPILVVTLGIPFGIYIVKLLIGFIPKAKAR
jgi:hypothetical protein